MAPAHPGAVTRASRFLGQASSTAGDHARDQQVPPSTGQSRRMFARGHAQDLLLEHGVSASIELRPAIESAGRDPPRSPATARRRNRTLSRRPCPAPLILPPVGRPGATGSPPGANSSRPRCAADRSQPVAGQSRPALELAALGDAAILGARRRSARAITAAPGSRLALGRNARHRRGGVRGELDRRKRRLARRARLQRAPKAWLATAFTVASASLPNDFDFDRTGRRQRLQNFAEALRRGLADRRPRPARSQRGSPVWSSPLQVAISALRRARPRGRHSLTGCPLPWRAAPDWDPSPARKLRGEQLELVGQILLGGRPLQDEGHRPSSTVKSARRSGGGR